MPNFNTYALRGVLQILARGRKFKLPFRAYVRYRILCQSPRHPLPASRNLV